MNLSTVSQGINSATIVPTGPPVDAAATVAGLRSVDELRYAAEIQRVVRQTSHPAQLAMQLAHWIAQRPAVASCRPYLQHHADWVSIGTGRTTPDVSSGQPAPTAASPEPVNPPKSTEPRSAVELSLAARLSEAYAHRRLLPAEPLSGAVRRSAVEREIVIPLLGNTPAAVVVALKEGVSPATWTHELTAAELLRTSCELRWQEQQAADATQLLQHAAATVELLESIPSALSLQQSCQLVVDRLQNYLSVERVAVGLRERNGTCRVWAVSGIQLADQQAAELLPMAAAIHEATIRGSFSAWPPLPGATIHQLLAHKQLAGREGCVLSVPLRNSQGESIGAILVQGPRTLANQRTQLQFLQSLDRPLGLVLAARRHWERHWLYRLWRTWNAREYLNRRRLMAGVAVAATIAGFCPVPYTVNCRAVVEPSTRRYCVAPYAGLVETVLVEPGDWVQAGQVLARMDTRELAWEMAGLSADVERAEKKAAMHQARHEVADGVLAELERDRLKTAQQLATLRQERHEILSPITGRVLAGQQDRRAGFPVHQGEVLLEVSPLDRVRLELAVPAHEISFVAPGLPVQLKLDGQAAPHSAQITRLRPQAESRDQSQVFVAEVEIENPTEDLRPGMKGFGTIRGSRRPLGWIVFHRCLERWAQWWPWYV